MDRLSFDFEPLAYGQLVLGPLAKVNIGDAKPFRVVCKPQGFDFELESPPTPITEPLDLDAEFSSEDDPREDTVVEPPFSLPQESFTREDPDNGMTLHGFTGKVLDPETNTVKHYVKGEQVHGNAYEDSVVNDPDVTPTTEEGWSHEGTPLVLGENATHIKGSLPEDETTEKGDYAGGTETTTQRPEEVDPHKASYATADQVGILHGETPEEVVPKQPQGESEHILGTEGELEEADPDAEKLRDESLKFIQKTATTTLSKFPEGAKSVLKKNAPNVSFFSSAAKLSEELAKVSPEVADNVSKGILYHGAYLPESKRLLLDGGDEKGTTEEIHSYEMSRAMADGRDESPEWKQAVDKDFKDESLTVYANDPKRAWGEFGRLAIGKQVSPDALRQKYPTATAVWESYGLLPKGGKGEMVELPEVFKPDVALSDDPTAEADSAYSLKEVGIATYARMGRGSLQWLKDNVELVGDWAKGILSKTPPPLRMAVTGAMKRIYFSYYLANQVTSQIAKARGIPEDKAKWLASTLTGADFLFGTSKILPIVTAAGASSAGASPIVAAGAAIAANFLPVGSLAYIALAGGLETWKQASKRVKTIVDKRKEAGAEFSDFEKEDLLEIITSHIAASEAKDHHLWLACFLSAMDETEGNVRVSCEIADEASGGEDTDFSEDTPRFNPPLDFGGGLDINGSSSRETKYGNSTIIYGADGKGSGEIISLRTPQAKRGKGSARLAMNEFLSHADKHGLKLKLAASPLDKRTHLGKLVNFYKSLGFNLTGRTINPAGDPEMTREPIKPMDFSEGDAPTPELPKSIVDFGPDDKTVMRALDAPPAKRDVGPEASPISENSHKAGKHSGVALGHTIHALKNSQPHPKLGRNYANSTLLSLAARAHKHAKEGAHMSAAMDHSLLFRAHSERGHQAAHIAHWNAYTANERLANKVDFSGNMLDLDKEFELVDFSKKHWDTPEFKKWFEGSKITHPETGEPLTVYHGVNSSIPFNEFDPKTFGNAQGNTEDKAFFFTSKPSIADIYADPDTWKIPKGQVIPTYLSMKNPYIHDFGGHGVFSGKLGSKTISQIRDMGHDGFVMKNVHDAGYEPSDVYGVFHPHQIKSAIANKGTYSSEDPRIDFSQESAVADFTKSKVQMVVDALKSDFKEPDKGRKLKSTIKEGLEEGSQSVIDRFYKGEVPKEVIALRKKYIDNQMGYLVAYVDDVYKGNVAIDPSRSAMYANSLKCFQAEILQFKAERKDAKWERRLLGKGDSSCPACVKLYMKGWKKFGTLPKIGDTTCKSNCNCKFQYAYDKKKPQ